MSPDDSRDRLAHALGADADHVVMERGFSLAFVGAHGQARLIQFRLSKKGFSADRAADDAVFAAGLDELAAHVDGLLRERWGGIALRVAFDGEGEVIPRLYAEGPLRDAGAVDPAVGGAPLAAPGEAVDARTLLVRASARPVENWGVFERADGHFVDSQRCRALAAGVPA